MIGQVMAFTVAEAATFVRAWMDEAASDGLPIRFEIHRNCITNDLYLTLQLMDAVPEIPICADPSHYVVDRDDLVRDLLNAPCRRTAGHQAPAKTASSFT